MASSFDDQAIALLEEQMHAHLWPPFTQMQGVKPIVIARGEGALVWDAQGNEYLDTFAALWTVNVGHGRQEIIDAIAEQAKDISCYHLFGGMANAPSIRLATKLAEKLPGDLNHVFLTISGGEAVETALKIGRQYWRNLGKGSKYMVLYRDRAYHGTGFGSVSVQGLTANRQKFEPLLPGFIRVGTPYCYRCAWGKEYGDCGLECAESVENEILYYGAENVGTMIGETVIGTGGVVPPPPEYWPRVRQICDAHDVLLINDEVITGAGRAGAWFATELFGARPDMITMAKGLGSGYLPLGAVGASDKVFEAFLGEPGEMKQFMSGATFQGHPLCSAAGLANLEILEREKLVERCAEVGPYLQDGLKTLLAHPIVGDVRGVGMVAGIEYVQDKATREWFPPTASAAYKIFAEAMKKGVLLRVLLGGNLHAVAPPFIISKEQIDTLVRVLDESITVVEKELGY